MVSPVRLKVISSGSDVEGTISIVAFHILLCVFCILKILFVIFHAPSCTNMGVAVGSWNIVGVVTSFPFSYFHTGSPISRRLVASRVTISFPSEFFCSVISIIHHTSTGAMSIDISFDAQLISFQ